MENKKTVIVTGATGAIGKAIALKLAEKHYEFEVVLACRDTTKAEQAVDEIKVITDNINVRYEIVDLSLHQSIKSFAKRWQGPLHVLINNAATTPRRREQTAEGIEMQFATNVLGYFWMIKAFTPYLKIAAPSRVINVASYWAGDLNTDDPEFKKRPYDNNSAYRQSKQADRMLTVAFAGHLKEFEIKVNACHPGDVNSRLSNNLGFGGSQSAAEGAETPVWLASEDIGQKVTGHYFENMREVKCRFSGNPKAIENLYNLCNAYSD